MYYRLVGKWGQEIQSWHKWWSYCLLVTATSRWTWSNLCKSGHLSIISTFDMYFKHISKSKKFSGGISFCLCNLPATGLAFPKLVTIWLAFPKRMAINCQECQSSNFMYPSCFCFNYIKAPYSPTHSNIPMYNLPHTTASNVMPLKSISDTWLS